MFACKGSMALVGLLLSAQAAAQVTPPTMKMTTDIPDDIETPAVVETRLGQLQFQDGLRQRILRNYSTTTSTSCGVSMRS